MTSELQVVGKAASIAIQTRRHGCETKQNKTTRNNDKQNDKTKARAEEREKSIGWIGRLFTAWRVSHAERTERRAERESGGSRGRRLRGGRNTSGNPVVSCNDAPEGDPSASISRGGTSVRRERVDLSNDMTGRQMIAVGVKRVILARGELDKLEGPGYAAKRAELRREARARDRQAAASSQNEAEGSEATEEEATRERTTRVGRPRGGMRILA